MTSSTRTSEYQTSEIMQAVSGPPSEIKVTKYIGLVDDRLCYENHRIRVSVASKLQADIIIRRLTSIRKERVHENQANFRPGWVHIDYATPVKDVWTWAHPSYIHDRRILLSEGGVQLSGPFVLRLTKKTQRKLTSSICACSQWPSTGVACFRSSYLNFSIAITNDLKTCLSTIFDATR